MYFEKVFVKQNDWSLISNRSVGSSLIFSGWNESNVDVWKDSTCGDSGVSHKSGELLVISDGELNMSWDNSWSSVVSGGVTCEFEDLSGEVFKDGGKINWGTGTNSLGMSSLPKMSGDSSYWELESSSGGSGYWSWCGGFSFSASSVFAWHLI